MMVDLERNYSAVSNMGYIWSTPKKDRTRAGLFWISKRSALIPILQ
jgi:hypothetical protein